MFHQMDPNIINLCPFSQYFESPQLYLWLHRSQVLLGIVFNEDPVTNFICIDQGKVIAGEISLYRVITTMCDHHLRVCATYLDYH